MNIARWGGLKYQSFTSKEPILTNNEQEKSKGRGISTCSFSFLLNDINYYEATES